MLQFNILKDRLTTLEKEYNILKEEFEDLSKVFVVKNLTKQLSDKQNEIDMLNKRINKQPVVCWKLEVGIKLSEPEPEPESEPKPTRIKTNSFA